ncbi:PQQ-binding-like beta-propeller repeat protein [bacterium]|nr:PQQ-binding-like beta-propeller repeat protein [bacterium]
MNTTESTMQKPFRSQWIHAAARGALAVSAAFSLVICVLLIANYFQIRALDPLDSPAMAVLYAQLEQNPDDAQLQEQIRALDLLARKAYFTSKWQIKTGGFLLLCGIVVFFASAKTMQEIEKKQPGPESLSGTSAFWKDVFRARQAIIFSGAGLIVLSISLAALTYSGLETGVTAKSGSAFPAQEEIMQQWPGFRGPGGNGHGLATGLPVSWDVNTGTHMLWKAAIPKPGMSSPVIWDDYVFVTGADKDGEQVYCYNAGTGEMRWQHEVRGITGSPPREQWPDVSAETGYAAPTAATDGQAVFALFGTGDLVGLDMNGGRLWAKNLGVPENHYGHSSSLIVYENLLIVQYDQNENSRLIAIQTASGQTAWEQRRGSISWSSPICVDINGRMELILTNSESVHSYDPRTGKLLWHSDCLYGEVAPSAAYADGLVFVANEYATASAIRVPHSSAEPEIVWEWDEYLPNTSSPLADSHVLILATADGFVNCLNAKTGEVYWEQEFRNGFYASPVLAENHVYLMDMGGVMHIFNMDSVYVSAGEPSVGEDVFSTPGMKNSRLYIRGESHLFCFGS